MKNSDRPARPNYGPQAPAADFNWTNGLSKREEFAKAAMHGLLANPNLIGLEELSNYNCAIASAIDVFAKFRADALLEALEGK